MGKFRVIIEAVGNHGCQRDEQRADPQMDVVGCGQPTCTDCLAREFVNKLRAIGTNVTEATIHHWPGLTGGDAEVVDNLLTQKRIGTF